MELFAIYAMTTERVIGKDGQLPWHLPADLAHFKSLSRGKPNIMGRKVWDSLGRRALPNRTNIILTRQKDFQAAGALVAHDPQEALEMAAAEDPSAVAIIGGAEIYKLYAPFLSRLEETLIHATLTGDTTMPSMGTDWQEVSVRYQEADEKNPYAMTFRTLIRSGFVSVSSK